MRHYKKGRKLGTDWSHTKAMKRSLVKSLFQNDRIKTVEERAKVAVAGLAEVVVRCAVREGLVDTEIGERGVKLSGGQKQRLEIARTLALDPTIVILDEATSALDNETETAVMESIDALQGHKTLIIVAHRLSTIRNCDTIYEIGDGIATKRTKKEVFGE